VTDFGDFLTFRTREPVGHRARHIHVQEIIVGSEALAAGVVTRQTLRTKYVKLHYNVYARAGMRLDATDRARAAWLWSRRTATLVGSSAAAMHGSLWLPDHVPAELAHARQPAPPGILIHRGAIADDEICLVASIYCTTPARTAYDIGRRVRTYQSFASMRCSMPPAAPSPSAESPTATRERVASGGYAPL
jgi:hypothetical protein